MTEENDKEFSQNHELVNLNN